MRLASIAAKVLLVISVLLYGVGLPKIGFAFIVATCAAIFTWRVLELRSERAAERRVVQRIKRLNDAREVAEILS